MQEVSTSLSSEVADFLYFTRASSDATSQEVVYLASSEARVNYVILVNSFFSLFATLLKRDKHTSE